MSKDIDFQLLHCFEGVYCKQMFNSIKKFFKRQNMASNDDNQNKIPIQSGFDREGMSNIDQIEECLYLSGVADAENPKVLKKLRIKYILSVFEDDVYYKSDSITYMKVEANDYYMEDLLSNFPDTNKFISNAQALNENVLVHCHAGLSRSATIVLAFIMYKHKMSYESAHALVSSRHTIMPNHGFVAQLQLYERAGYTLNANDMELRQYLMKTILNLESLWTTKHRNKIQVYFKRRDLAEDMTQELNLGPKCLCVKCGQHLFNRIHIFPINTSEIQESNPRTACNWTYIEPQKWMTSLTLPFERMSELVVKCPQCQEELIEFKKQFMEFWCECCLHNGQSGKCLRFRIANDKFKNESNI